MRVKLAIDVDDAARYVIARYFSVAPESERDKVRGRATRRQVRRFVTAAIETAVREYAANMRGRQRSTAKRLREGRAAEPEALLPPDETQPTLLNY